MGLYVKDNYVYFYNATSVFSNHYLCSFVLNNIVFNCVEQAMMYSKAKLFGDEKIAKLILAEKDPQKQKMLGRKVSNFDYATWNKKGDFFVYTALKAKFTQNIELQKILVSTGEKVLAEASERDTKWGIGISLNNVRYFNEADWIGENRLGRLLMLVRNEIQKGETK